MAAFVKLNGDSFRLDHRLRDHLGDRVPPIPRAPVEQGFDAAWVRGRIRREFGFTPEPTQVEKALLQVGFDAATSDGAACDPFVCTDHHGRSALRFSDCGPEDAVKRSIAEAFWGGPAREPEDLADFEQRVYHPGASVWLDYGCESGRVFCEMRDEESRPPQVDHPSSDGKSRSNTARSAGSFRSPMTRAIRSRKGGSNLWIFSAARAATAV